MAVIINDMEAVVLPEAHETRSGSGETAPPAEAQATASVLETLSLAQERQARLMVD